MTIQIVLILACLVLFVVAALAEDLSKLNGYAVTFGASPSISPTQDLAKLNGYAVVVGGASPASSARGFGSLSLGIN